eukprot:9571170-Ditylum_brightwellii.AAC.1
MSKQESSRKLHGQPRELHVQQREPKELEAEQEPEPKKLSGKPREQLAKNPKAQTQLKAKPKW